MKKLMTAVLATPRQHCSHLRATTDTTRTVRLTRASRASPPVRVPRSRFWDHPGHSAVARHTSRWGFPSSGSSDPSPAWC